MRFQKKKSWQFKPYPVQNEYSVQTFNLIIVNLLNNSF